MWGFHSSLISKCCLISIFLCFSYGCDDESLSRTGSIISPNESDDQMDELINPIPDLNLMPRENPDPLATALVVPENAISYLTMKLSVALLKSNNDGLMTGKNYLASSLNLTSALIALHSGANGDSQIV